MRIRGILFSLAGTTACALACAGSFGCSSPTGIEPVRSLSRLDVDYEAAVAVGPGVAATTDRSASGHSAPDGKEAQSRPAADGADGNAGATGAALVDAQPLEAVVTLVAVPREVAREVLGVPDSGLFGFATDGAEPTRLLAALDDRTSARIVQVGTLRVLRGQRGALGMEFPTPFRRGWALGSPAVRAARGAGADADEDVTGVEPRDDSFDTGYEFRFGSQPADDGVLLVDISMRRTWPSLPLPQATLRLPDGEEVAVDVPLARIETLHAQGRLPAGGGGLVLGGLPIRDRDEWMVAFVRVAPAAASVAAR